MAADTRTLVTVFSTSNKGIFLVAKSVLEGSDIEYFTKNEYLEALAYGADTQEIRVFENNEIAARKLLENIQEKSPKYNTDEKQQDEFIRFKIYALIVLLIIVIFIAVCFVRC